MKNIAYDTEIENDMASQQRETIRSYNRKLWKALLQLDARSLDDVYQMCQMTIDKAKETSDKK